MHLRNSFNQHNKVRRPGGSHRGAGRKKKITIFVPAWMIPPIYHSLRRECIKNAAHSHPYGVRSVRPTWFEDSKIPSQPGRGDSTPFQPMHGLKLVIKEDVMPQEQMPDFPALGKLAANGFLSVETWNANILD